MLLLRIIGALTILVGALCLFDRNFIGAGILFLAGVFLCL